MLTDIILLIQQLPKSTWMLATFGISYFLYTEVFKGKVFESAAKTIAKGWFYIFLMQFPMMLGVFYAHQVQVTRTQINIEDKVMEIPLYAEIIKRVPEERNILLNNILLNDLKGESLEYINEQVRKYRGSYFLKYIYANAYKLPDDELIQFISISLDMFKQIKSFNKRSSCTKDKIGKLADFRSPDEFIIRNIDKLLSGHEPVIISEGKFEELMEPVHEIMGNVVDFDKGKFFVNEEANICETSILLLETIKNLYNKKDKIDLFRYLMRYRLPPKEYIKP